MDIILVTAFVVIISFVFGYYAGKEESEKSAEETIKQATDETRTKMVRFTTTAKQ